MTFELANHSHGPVMDCFADHYFLLVMYLALLIFFFCSNCEFLLQEKTRSTTTNCSSPGVGFVPTEVGNQTAALQEALMQVDALEMERRQLLVQVTNRDCETHFKTSRKKELILCL